LLVATFEHDVGQREREQCLGQDGDADEPPDGESAVTALD